MELETADASPQNVYKWLIGIVTPRPIAWVTTMDRKGRVNLAPYSFFNVFGSNPATVVFAPSVRADGTQKDTLLNIEETGEFVLNAAVEDLAEAVNSSSRELPRGESEVEMTGLTLMPSSLVKPPRIAEAPTHLECRLLRIITVGEGSSAGNLVLGQVVLIHVAEAVLDADGHVDPAKLRTIGRMGGPLYTRTGDRFHLDRPR